MEDKRKKENILQYQEMMLDILLDSYTQQDINEAIREYEEEESTEETEALIEKCCQAAMKELKKEHLRQRRKKIGRIAVKAAMFALMISGLIAAAAVTVKAVRYPVATAGFIQEGDGAPRLVFEGICDGTEINMKSAIERMRVLEKCMPDDYILVEERVDEIGKTAQVCYAIPEKGYSFSMFAHGVGGSEAAVSANVLRAEVMLLNGKEIRIYGYMDYWYQAWWMDEEAGIFYGFSQNGMTEEKFLEIIGKFIA